MNNGITFYFIIFVLAVMVVIFIQNRSTKARGLPKQPDSDKDWEFGNEWQDSPKEIDLSDWEEVFSTKTHVHHAGRLSPGIQAADIRNNLEHEPIGLDEIQQILSDHNIQSKISVSKTYSQSEGLYVEKKNSKKALQILKRS